MENNLSILPLAQTAATEILLSLPKSLVYHNLSHTREVVMAADKIGTYCNLTETEKEILLLSAWFHDTGFRHTYDRHEDKSIEVARDFLEKHNYPEDKMNQVIESIDSTRVNKKPQNTIQKILHDADFIHLSKKSYFDKLFLLKSELEHVKGKNLFESDWHKNNLDFLNSHYYYTDYGQTVLAPKVDKNKVTQIKILQKLGRQKNEAISKDLKIDPIKIKELKKKLKEVEDRPGRDVGAMYRIKSRNYLKLSAMANSKANILILVNSIIFSIIIGGVIQSLGNNPQLTAPSYILLVLNIVIIIFSILILRPNVNKGKYLRKDIENKNINLSSFGNFREMSKKDYKQHMIKMMNDANYLYSSFIDDIYFLAKLLDKKNKYLRLSYNIFMIGIVLVVLAYIIANIIYFNGGNIQTSYRISSY